MDLSEYFETIYIDLDSMVSSKYSYYQHSLFDNINDKKIKLDYLLIHYFKYKEFVAESSYLFDIFISYYIKSYPYEFLIDYLINIEEVFERQNINDYTDFDNLKDSFSYCLFCLIKDNYKGKIPFYNRIYDCFSLNNKYINISLFASIVSHYDESKIDIFYKKNKSFFNSIIFSIINNNEKIKSLFRIFDEENVMSSFFNLNLITNIDTKNRSEKKSFYRDINAICSAFRKRNLKNTVIFDDAKNLDPLLFKNIDDYFFYNSLNYKKLTYFIFSSRKSFSDKNEKYILSLLKKHKHLISSEDLSVNLNLSVMINPKLFISSLGVFQYYKSQFILKELNLFNLFEKYYNDDFVYLSKYDIKFLKYDVDIINKFFIKNVITYNRVISNYFNKGDFSIKAKSFLLNEKEDIKRYKINSSF